MFNTLGQTNKAVWDWLDVTTFQGHQVAQATYLMARGVDSCAHQACQLGSFASEDQANNVTWWTSQLLMVPCMVRDSTQSVEKLPHKHMPLVKKNLVNKG